MALERFNPLNNKIEIFKSFTIKPVKCRLWLIKCDGNIYKPKCLKCNKEIEDGERCWNGYINKYDEVILRKYANYKVCAQCGLDILVKMTPNKLLNQIKPLKLMENL